MISRHLTLAIALLSVQAAGASDTPPPAVAGSESTATKSDYTVGMWVAFRPSNGASGPYNPPTLPAIFRVAFVDHCDKKHLLSLEGIPGPIYPAQLLLPQEVSQQLPAWALGDSFDRGRVALAAESYRDAIAHFTDVLRWSPNNADAYFYRGVAYELASDGQRALGDLFEAVRFGLARPAYYATRARIAASMNFHNRAIEDDKEALRLAPGDFRILFHRARSYDALGQYSHAIQDYSVIAANASTNGAGTALLDRERDRLRGESSLRQGIARRKEERDQEAILPIEQLIADLGIEVQDATRLLADRKAALKTRQERLAQTATPPALAVINAAEVFFPPAAIPLNFALERAGVRNLPGDVGDYKTIEKDIESATRRQKSALARRSAAYIELDRRYEEGGYPAGPPGSHLMTPASESPAPSALRSSEVGLAILERFPCDGDKIDRRFIELDGWVGELREGHPGRIGEANGELRKRILASPDRDVEIDRLVLDSLGEVYRDRAGLGDSKEYAGLALEYAERALIIDPSVSTAGRIRILALLKLGQYSEAILATDDRIHVFARLDEFVSRSLARKPKGDSAAAGADFKAALSAVKGLGIDTESGRLEDLKGAYLDKARIYELIGDRTSAIDEYRRILVIDPEDREALNFVAAATAK